MLIHFLPKNFANGRQTLATVLPQAKKTVPKVRWTVVKVRLTLPLIDAASVKQKEEEYRFSLYCPKETPMRIELELPEVHFLGLSPQEIAQQVRLLTALMRFGAGEISVGAACEVAGISHYAFYEACKKYRVPVLDYDENELDDELSNFTSC